MVSCAHVDYISRITSGRETAAHNILLVVSRGDRHQSHEIGRPNADRDSARSRGHVRKPFRETGDLERLIVTGEPDELPPSFEYRSIGREERV